MQNLQLAALVVIVVSALLVLSLSRRRRGAYRDPLSMLVVGLGMGALGVIIVFSLQTDLLPDGLEALLSPVFILVASGLLAFIGWRRLQQP